MIEAFGQYLLPEGMPLWQIIFFLAILPGICEEIAFRGVLLHGLRKRFSAVGTCIAVGLIFGLFHVDLFRLIPTAYLGILLAAVVVMSGSILPAIVWHAINNSVALVPAYMGIETDAPPVWLYPMAIVALAVALGVIYRYRVGGGMRSTDSRIVHRGIREAR
jgi:membrane protease YdiL (CAAX protease family)